MNIVATWIRNPWLTREVISTDKTPDEELVVWSFAVCLHIQNDKPQLILTKSHRGREHPGGWREIGESLEENLKREIAEEVAINQIDDYWFIGVRKYYCDDWRISKYHGEYKKETYLNLYVAVTTQMPWKPDWGFVWEIKEAWIFPLDHPVIDELRICNKEILKMALLHYEKHMKNTD